MKKARIVVNVKNVTPILSSSLMKLGGITKGTVTLQNYANAQIVEQ
jgi:hypothetical protein